jgi:hypothetical protein
MDVCTLNVHEIGEYQTTDYDTSLSGDILTIGSALEPSLVLLNHSCDPHIIRINVGRATMVFAARDIKVDCEVTDCYLSLGFKAPYQSRRQDLQKKYNFTCECQPCREQWPIVSDLPKGLQDVDPSKFKFPIDDIQKMKMQFSKIQTLGAKINQEQKKGNFEVCLALTVEFMRVLEDTIERPHQFYVMASRTLIHSLWLKHGSRCDVDGHCS